MSPPRKYLISGAGIAGLATAHWLAQGGAAVTLVERAADFRAGGHFISLKGTGVEVARAMGIEDELRSFEYPLETHMFSTRRGRLLRRSRIADSEANLDGYIFTRRAHLHGALYRARHPGIDIRFGTTIEGIEQQQPAAAVATLSDGSRESFDAIIGADGVHSTIRKLAFPELQPLSLAGDYIALLASFEHGLGTSSTRMFLGPGRNVNLIPVSEDRLGIVIYQDDALPPPPRREKAAAWRRYLRTNYADFAPVVRQALAGIADDDEVYADRILMIPASRVATGRIALVGDSGYCPTFFSGMGAAVALQGAYALGHALLNEADVPVALRSYEQRILPVARRYQSNAAGMRRLILARKWLPQMIRNGALGYLPQRLMAEKARKFYQSESPLSALV